MARENPRPSSPSRGARRRRPDVAGPTAGGGPVVDALERRVFLSAVVRSAARANAAAITLLVDAFRADLGAARREVNWDGVPAAAAAPNALPANFFNVNSPRGIVLATPGTSFQVSGAAADAGPGQPAAADFGNLNPTYPTAFEPFSASRLFTPIGSNVTDVTFFVPGTAAPATVSGFGSVVTDVDVANATSIQYFDRTGASLGTFFVPASAGDGGQSFVGVSFDAGERISRVRITAGNTIPGPNDVTQGGSADAVVMDDFLYAEPQPVGFTVTNTNDAGAGSLRQAVLDANAAPGIQTVSFAIPGGGVHTIAPLTALPTIVDPTVIDGYTQPGAAPNTRLVGNDATILIELDGSATPRGASGLTITAGNSTVRGLSVVGFRLRNEMFTTVGGFGIATTGFGNNVVAGNFVGLRPDGVTAAGNEQEGVSTDGLFDRVGGTAPADRNVVSGNLSNIQVSATGPASIVQGNYIGPDASGTRAVPNQSSGLVVADVNATVGGTAPGAGNLVSGNAFTGIILENSSTGHVVYGNLIGTNAAGTAPLGNGFDGVTIGAFATNNRIGGVAPGQANTVAYNGNAGVALIDLTGTVGNVIRGNAIFANGRLGIDLSPIGPTANDPNDPDGGANNHQNFPVLASAVSAGGSTTVTGVINTNANSALLIDFYASPAADPSGFGQGRTYLGSAPVALDTFGNNATFTATFPVAVPAGQVVTATATNVGAAPYGDTSEFSPAIEVTAPPLPPPGPTPALSVNDVSITEGNTGTKTVTFTVKLSAPAAGPVTVSYATANAWATAGSDYVAKSGTLTFAAGQLTRTVGVTVKGDTTVEPNEQFRLNLSNLAGPATIGDGSGLATILNDDPARPRLSVAGVSLTEGTGGGTKAFQFKVTLDKAAATPITVKFATSNGSASAGGDYAAAAGTLTFAANETTKWVTVLVSRDAVAEGAETFFLNLASPTGATVAVGKGTGTIRNDD